MVVMVEAGDCQELFTQSLGAREPPKSEWHWRMTHDLPNVNATQALFSRMGFLASLYMSSIDGFSLDLACRRNNWFGRLHYSGRSPASITLELVGDWTVTQLLTSDAYK